MTIRINIIGAGNLGKTIGYLMARQPAIQIGAVCNASETSTINAVQFIQAGQCCTAVIDLPPADITFITTPDDKIIPVSMELSKNPHLNSGSIIVHCSGSLASTVLNSLSDKGCLTAAIHPMKSFANPAISVPEFEGTYCALEGEAAALPVIQSLFESIGAIVYTINKNKKALYHAAGVFSSNYLITLAGQALNCMQEAGVSREMALPVIIKLMKSSLANLESTLSPEQSLTGPIQRGDVAVIEKHLQAFNNEPLKKLYKILGRTTLDLTSHDEATQNLIKKLLT